MHIVETMCSVQYPNRALYPESILQLFPQVAGQSLYWKCPVFQVTDWSLVYCNVCIHILNFFHTYYTVQYCCAIQVSTLQYNYDELCCVI